MSAERRQPALQVLPALRLALPALPEPEPLVLRALRLVPPVLRVPLRVPLPALQLVQPELPEPLHRHRQRSARLTLPARPV